MDKKDKTKNFTSAMDDLKGLLDKEGIDIGAPKEKSDQSDTTSGTVKVSDITDALNNDLINDFEQSLKRKSSDVSSTDDDSVVDLPILDGTITVTDEKLSTASDLDDYIADMDDDDFDVMDFASSVEELEETVEAIKEPEHLQEFVENHSRKVSMQELKSKLRKQLAMEIEKSIDEMKSKLLKSLNQELDRMFKE